ncbi:hypothetical protein EXIGLDRAFT_726353 [Exidia glandulosa HHB12029]|uniref:Uncharacterized protein n=1 Tax=Exidia glandulosa HHB12029 TaxID=1314781 RepID=A0A165DRG4_EXIGL|nr:hypothetical protein EXIGLDRAFT_726353 [Exidia glandulosa HHB12029]
MFDKLAYFDSGGVFGVGVKWTVMKWRNRGAKNVLRMTRKEAHSRGGGVHIPCARYERGWCSVSRGRSENVRGRQGRRREKLAIQDSCEAARARGSR